MMNKDDPRIEVWRDGVPFDENGKIIRGVYPTDEELKELREFVKSLPVDPDYDVNVRPWMRHCWWK